MMDEIPLDHEAPDRRETTGSSDFQLRLHAHILTAIWNRARGGSAVLFGALMLGNATAYIYHMFIARMMLPADYGIVVTLTSISYVLDVLVRTIQTGLTKTIATTQGAGVEHVRAVFVVAMRTLVPLAGMAFVGQWLASGWVADFLHLGTATPVILLALYASLSFLTPVPRGILLGLNRLYGASASIVSEPIVRLVIGLALVAWGLRANGALTGYAVGHFAAFAIGLVLIRPLLDQSTGHASPSAAFDGLNRYVLQVLIVNTCLMIMASVDQITVKHFFSADVAGNYAVTFVLGRVIVMSAISLGTVVFTRSATMHRDDPGRAHLLAKGLLVMGAIAMIATSGFLAAPALIVRLMAGSQYGTAPGYIGLVGIEMTLFSLVYVQAYYHISLRKMQVAWPLCFAVALQIALLARYHSTVQQVLIILIAVMGGVLVCVSALSWWILRANSRPTPIVVPGSSQGSADI